MVRRSPAAQTTSVGPYTLAKPSVAVGRGSTPRLSASELDRAGVRNVSPMHGRATEPLTLTTDRVPRQSLT